MISAIIIEDETDSREGLEILLNMYCPDVELTGTAPSVAEGLSLIKKENPDLIFLDVELGDSTAFSLLDKVKPEQRNFEIIFTTAHSGYALQAIKAHPFDYLLKPINQHELIHAVKKVTERIHGEKPSIKQPEPVLSPGSDQIILFNNQDMIFVYTKDILYCKAEGPYTCFYFTDGSSHLASQNIKEYESPLELKNFFRIHRSYLVNGAHIKKISRKDNGNVVLTNGELIPVSKRRKLWFLSKLGVS